jgi:hypothetical protein
MTTLTLYRYPKSQIFWAFTQMQLAHSKLDKTHGLWGSINPFEPLVLNTPIENTQLAVLT